MSLKITLTSNSFLKCAVLYSTEPSSRDSLASLHNYVYEFQNNCQIQNNKYFQVPHVHNGMVSLYVLENITRTRINR